MEEEKQRSLFEYISEKTGSVYTDVKANGILATGQSMASDIYHTGYDNYAKPLVHNINLNYIVTVKTATEESGKKVAEKADRFARYMVGFIPTQFGRDLLSQLGSSKVVQKARSVADTSMVVLTSAADTVICRSLETFDKQVVDRLCSRPPPQISPKGLEYIPYMQSRLQVELYEWASFKYEEIHNSKTYGYLNSKLEIDNRAGRAKDLVTSGKDFVTSGGIAKLEWPQTAKDRVCGVLSRVGLGEKLVNLVDSWVWVKIDSDSDGKVTLGDIWLTAQYVTLEFPKEAATSLIKKIKSTI